MITKKMYIERKGNIAAFRGCSFNCCYCAFRNTLSRSKCQDDRQFKPHAHLEVLNKRPPPVKDGEFLSIGLNGDISFMDVNRFCDVLDYCSDWGDRTFLIQSKNPEWFLQFYHRITSNVIIGTTIESNCGAWWYKNHEMFQHLKPNDREQIHYNNDISKAPLPIDRYEAMLKLNCRKAVTIEPILDFDWQYDGQFLNWIKQINPELLWIGYDSRPEKNRLPEPILTKTEDLIKQLIDNGISVRQKLIRKAWFEGAQ